MLDQNAVDRLLAVAKRLSSLDTIDFPAMGTSLVLDATDFEEREQFKIDVQRKGMRRVAKCTFQERYQQTEILLRVDVDGPMHENPDGDVVPCPHLHVYREGFADKWAYPLPSDKFPDPANLELTLKSFLKYCVIEVVPQVQRTMG